MQQDPSIITPGKERVVHCEGVFFVKGQSALVLPSLEAARSNEKLLAGSDI